MKEEGSEYKYRMEIEEYKLCFVKSFDRVHVLYFTPFDARNVDGDDWDDKAYEHNAGNPYQAKIGNYKYTRNTLYDTEVWQDVGNELVRLIVYDNDEDVTISSPCSGYLNSPFSVKDINAGEIAWLRVTRFLPNGNSERIYVVANNDYKTVCQKLKGLVYTMWDWRNDGKEC